MKTVQLGKHAVLIRGITFKPADKCAPEDDGAIVCMRTTNVQATLDQSDLIAVPSTLVKGREKILSEGDILVSSANSWNLVGKCCRVRDLLYPSTAGGFISILRPTTAELDSGYLYRWFSSGEVQATLRSLGNQTTNISNLSHKRTLNLQIPLPPLTEQKRIAGILDAADALRAKRRESLAQLDTLLQSTFLDMFGDPVTNPMGWATTSIGMHIKVLGGYAFKSADYADDGVPIIRISNLSGDSVHLEGCARIPTPKLGKGTRFRLQPGDTLIAMSGATTGKLGFVPDDLDEEWFLNQRVGAFRVPPDSAIHREYLRAVLRSSFYQDHVWNLAGGAAQPNISGRQLESATVTLPPMDLQRRFATIVESVGQQKAQQKAHLAELDTLFASLQSRAFRGEL